MKEGITLLYVDDEPINGQLFKINFSEYYDLFVASDGMEALKILENEPTINIVLTDMVMPGVNGIEFIEMSKKRFPGKCYVLLTGLEITPDIQDCLDGRLIDAFLNKPYDRKDLISVIQSLQNKELT